MRLPNQSQGANRSGNTTRIQTIGIFPSLRIGGALSAKCESDDGAKCDCGAGKCCIATPTGCACDSCGGGPISPKPPITAAYF